MSNITIFNHLENTSDVASRLDSDGVGTTEVLDNRGVQQKTNVVTEAGLYEVIIRSDKPEAKGCFRTRVRRRCP